MNRKAHYSIGEDGTFTIENFNHATPYANFLPGYAGKWGKPIWAYYVNRGQCMATFGVRDKDHSILEFDSANLHYRRIFQEGFRTFIKCKGIESIYEPFSLQGTEKRNTTLIQKASSLAIEEINEDAQLAIRVVYFTVPNEDFGALVRRVTIKNFSDKKRSYEILDGLPKVVPYGRIHFLLKHMPFITDGYLEINNLKENTPYFTLANVPTDEAETKFVEFGNYCIGFSNYQGTKSFTKKIVDPKLIFDEYLDFARPYRFEDDSRFSLEDHQDVVCQTPCAFNYVSQQIEAGAEVSIESVWGAAKGVAELKSIQKRVMKPGYLDKKEKENERLVNGLMDGFYIHSGDPLLNAYVRQSFLDNTLRGGYPVIIDSKKGKVPFYAFSRLHGDLERDYNNFVLEPTFYSCGNGRFRDVNQNRRNDSWLNLAVGESNIKYFFNLIQLDGFNPLVCGNQAFRVNPKSKLTNYISQNFNPEVHDKLMEFLSKDFTPGEYANFLKGLAFTSHASLDELVNGATALAEVIDIAEHDTGYWSDHWMYNFDLLFRYLDLYPEECEALLIEDSSYTYFDTEHFVKKRADKYVEYMDGGIRHLISVGINNKKASMIAFRPQDAHLVRKNNGVGRVYRVTLLSKILTLLTVKMATHSSSGLGIDMEGGRPGWCDSVNGLPSLFGAELPAQYKLHSVLSRLIDSLQTIDQKEVISVHTELFTFLEQVVKASQEFFEHNDSLVFWKVCNNEKEKYREATLFGVSGKEMNVPLSDIAGYFAQFKSHLEKVFKDGFDKKNGLPVTFMTHNPTSYKKTGAKNPKGLPCVEVSDFKSHKFAPFLEGSVFRMEYEKEINKKQALYKKVKNSSLYDKTLGLYKIAVDLETEPKEQGRTGGWPKGWFENESVFMHVQYKYLLQLLQGGLYDEFFENLRKCFPIYQDPAIYGRSPFENVSFIAPTTHLRPSYHGRGMQARLTGTNSEVLHMMLIMSFGHRPFALEDGTLTLSLKPILDEQLFTVKRTNRTVTFFDGTSEVLTSPANSYTALFLGKTVVTYHNPSRKKSYGDNGVSPVRYTCEMCTKEKVAVEGPTIPSDLAQRIRRGEAVKIDVALK